MATIVALTLGEHPMNPHALILLTVLAAVLWYAAACAFAPYAPCPRCKGTGHVNAGIRRRSKPCRRCSGAGRLLRIGRRLFTKVTPPPRTEVH